jgi:nickel-dependent lactate racemase
MSGTLSAIAPSGQSPDEQAVRTVVAQACPAKEYAGKRVLLIVPDATRTAPIGLMFRLLHQQLAAAAQSFDVLVALGTHPPMTCRQIEQRLEISSAERSRRYAEVKFFNHSWNDPQSLRSLGAIPAAEIRELSGGLFAMDVPVQINRLIFDYDQLIIVGPVFPHEVIGFSGGNKYLFPGISGPDVLNFFHWLGAVVTNPLIIGRKLTPVRRVVDRAAAMVTVSKLCFCLVADQQTLAGVFAGSPESAWDAASDLSAKLHVTYKDKPFHTILSCAPPMYDELWTAGKCMYKLEPVLADGGELIIYAPHLARISLAHGRLIEEIGYHCRDYFLKQWDRFKPYPWAVLAHSTHVKGIGAYNNGVETPRARVTLATQLPPETCRRVNLGYRNPATIRVEDFAGRESEGVLLVPKAGEQLFQL